MATETSPATGAEAVCGHAAPGGVSVCFSVVITLFNKRAYIRRTVESALAQRHDCFEILIVDDGSTDGSVEEIADLLGSNVRLLRKENAGPGPARNHGIREARYDWIALLDGDDLWMPHHLSSLEDLVRQFPEAGAVATSFQRLQPGNEVSALVPVRANGYIVNYFTEAATREPVWTSCVAIRQDVLVQTGGFGAFWPGEDEELWARIALEHAFAVSLKQTAYYRVGTGGLMDQSATAAGTTSQPIFKLLEAALADDRYSSKHPDIRLYRDKLVARDVRQALYRGDVAAARAYLSLVARPRTGELALLSLVSYLPTPLIAGCLKAYRMLKEVRVSALAKARPT